NSGERSFNALGVVGKLEELTRDYLDSVDGILTARDRALGTQIDLQQKRIEDFNDRLLARQQVLQNQFAAMERALANLQRQQSALASLQAAG
ncbi:MAG TPA: hypothetical protein ENJ00_09460, partial [Phycisphaerales bacterium]|nr:hypothetical protein [Phycisphaerales bacterium]